MFYYAIMAARLNNTVEYTHTHAHAHTHTNVRYPHLAQHLGPH